MVTWPWAAARSAYHIPATPLPTTRKSVDSGTDPPGSALADPSLRRKSAGRVERDGHGPGRILVRDAAAVGLQEDEHVALDGPVLVHRPALGDRDVRDPRRVVDAGGELGERADHEAVL